MMHASACFRSAGVVRGLTYNALASLGGRFLFVSFSGNDSRSLAAHQLIHATNLVWCALWASPCLITTPPHHHCCLTLILFPRPLPTPTHPPASASCLPSSLSTNQAQRYVRPPSIPPPHISLCLAVVHQWVLALAPAAADAVGATGGADCRGCACSVCVDETSQAPFPLPALRVPPNQPKPTLTHPLHIPPPLHTVHLPLLLQVIMGGGNGAKSASKRERNAKAKGPEAKSILKDKEKMMSQMCMICRVSSM